MGLHFIVIYERFVSLLNSMQKFVFVNLFAIFDQMKLKGAVLIGLFVLNNFQDNFTGRGFLFSNKHSLQNIQLELLLICKH